MLMVMRFCSPPYNKSEIANAVSVFPTPDGPTSMNTPFGLLGSSMPARDVRRRAPPARDLLLELLADLTNALHQGLLLFPAGVERCQLPFGFGSLLLDARQALVVIRADGRLALEHAPLYGEILESALRRLDRPRRRSLA